MSISLGITCTRTCGGRSIDIDRLHGPGPANRLTSAARGRACMHPPKRCSQNGIAVD